MSSHSAELHAWRFLVDERWISAAIVAALEHDVLQHLDPPLNLMGMRTTAIRLQLKQLRRELSY